MRGRNIFSLIKPFIAVIVLLEKAFPVKFHENQLKFWRYLPGLCGIGIRYIIIKASVKSCGDNLSVHDSVFFKHIREMQFGSNVSIHPLCYLDGYGSLIIGNDVSIAHNVSILSFEHDYLDLSKPIKDADCIKRPVVIEDDVWLGAGVRILGGVTIGKGSIVGAGAVVSKDIPPYSIAVGVPAKVVKSRKGLND